MKIQVVSDLHLEFSDINITNNIGADVLILSGDIAIAEYLHDHDITEADRPQDPEVFWKLRRTQALALRFRNFLKRCSLQFPHVVYVAGNHEFYHGKWMQTLTTLESECNNFPNVHFLEKQSFEIDNVVFLGATVWTDCGKADPVSMQIIGDSLNDFRYVRNDLNAYTKLRPVTTVGRHRETLEYFKSTIDSLRSTNAGKKVVVVGHHAPSYLSIHEKYRHDHHMNQAYASDLSEFILDHPEIVLWTHGHVHNTFDYCIGSTRIVCNPRGYESEGERSGWDPNFTVEI